VKWGCGKFGFWFVLVAGGGCERERWRM